MSIIENIKAFFTDPTHLRLLGAFIVVYIGLTFPQYQTLCNMIAYYLGATIVVTAGRAMLGGSVKK